MLPSASSCGFEIVVEYPVCVLLHQDVWCCRAAESDAGFEGCLVAGLFDCLELSGAGKKRAAVPSACIWQSYAANYDTSQVVFTRTEHPSGRNLSACLRTRFGGGTYSGR